MNDIPRVTWPILGAVSAGGALGSLLRWGLSSGVSAYGGWPWATFLANVTGAVSLGVVLVIALEVRPGSRFLRPFWGAGVCGGYTTFSAFALEVHHLLADGRMVLATAYAVTSVLAGVLGITGGIATTRALRARKDS